MPETAGLCKSREAIIGSNIAQNAVGEMGFFSSRRSLWGRPDESGKRLDHHFLSRSGGASADNHAHTPTGSQPGGPQLGGKIELWCSRVERLGKLSMHIKKSDHCRGGILIDQGNRSDHQEGGRLHPSIFPYSGGRRGGPASTQKNPGCGQGGQQHLDWVHLGDRGALVFGDSQVGLDVVAIEESI